MEDNIQSMLQSGFSCFLFKFHYFIYLLFFNKCGQSMCVCVRVQDGSVCVGCAISEKKLNECEP